MRAVPRSAVASLFAISVLVASDQVLLHAREALGGEERLNALKSLSVSGTALVRAEAVTPGPVKAFALRNAVSVDILLPDNFVAKYSSSFGSTSSGLNKGEAWTSDPGGDAALVVDSFRRWLLLLTLSAPQVSIRHIGQSQNSEGKFDVLLATAPDGFSVRIFLNPETHLPVILAYRNVNALTAPTPGGRGKEFQLRPSAYETFDGIRFPSLIHQLLDGTETQVLQMKKYAINPALNPRKFRH